MQIKSKLDSINKRLSELDNGNNKIILECISDLENDKSNLYYLIKVLNRFNEVIDASEMIDIPRQTITSYLDRYQCSYDMVFFDIKNGIKTPTTPLKYNYYYYDNMEV